jgi:predicted PurR-regulated permease PerM/GAF domain-containing protein
MPLDEEPRSVAHSRTSAQPDSPRSEGPQALHALLGLVPGLRLMVGAVLAALVIAALYFGQEILVPLALAFLLGFVLDPMVTRLKRWGLPRPAAVGVVVVLALGLIVGAGIVLGSQVKALSTELPTFQQNIKHKLGELRASLRSPGALDGVVKTMNTVRNEVETLPPPETSGGGAAKAPVQRVQIEGKGATPVETAMGWLSAVAGPLATAGIVLVFVVLVLLDRQDLRDRFVRLLGMSLHRSTDAMDEAGERIGKYLRMQLLVNVSYGIPMGVGLWFIGVPGALLWGALAAVMRFVPYVGPMISAVFPLLLAFAIDPGCSLVLWTLGLILLLELVSNNVIEPWLYGSSTGLSAMSLMVSATFWTVLWGPIGLIMSTPLTVCLLVVGRHLPQLQWLHVLLGSQPALDPPTRLYQRLLAEDVDEAVEVALDSVEGAENVVEFYDGVAIAALRLAVDAHGATATVEHRLRLVEGMDAVLDELHEQYPPQHAPKMASAQSRVVCMGGKWEVDQIAARMLSHALQLQGLDAEVRTQGQAGDALAGLDLDNVGVVCLSYFTPDPQTPARHLARRLQRRWPQLQVLLLLWNAPPEMLEPVGEDSSIQQPSGRWDSAGAAPAAFAVATSIAEATLRVAQRLGTALSQSYLPAPIPEGDAERVQVLHASAALEDEDIQALFQTAAQRAADVFDVPLGVVSLLDAKEEHVRAVHGHLPGTQSLAGDLHWPREDSVCGHVVAGGELLVVPDIARDPRFAGNPVLRERGARFYAGAPLKDEQGLVWGALALVDAQPRRFDASEARLLGVMANDLMMQVMLHMAQAHTARAPQPAPAAAPQKPDDEPPSATVGQIVPS